MSQVVGAALSPNLPDLSRQIVIHLWSPGASMHGWELFGYASIPSGPRTMKLLPKLAHARHLRRMRFPFPATDGLLGQNKKRSMAGKSRGAGIEPESSPKVPGRTTIPL
jgi:hypothetical protein